MMCTKWAMIKLLLMCCHVPVYNNEIFKQNIGDEMEIGITENYQKVELKCDAELALVHLEFYKKFGGLIYTRGSFHKIDSPCFFNLEQTNLKEVDLKIPLKKCLNKGDGQIYSNVLVVQHDRELIMPGDMAFHLECDFRQPRDITVTTSIQSEFVKSKLILTDPDPSKEIGQIGIISAENYSNTVILTPKKFRMRREEL